MGLSIVAKRTVLLLSFLLSLSLQGASQQETEAQTAASPVLAIESDNWTERLIASSGQEFPARLLRERSDSPSDYSARYRVAATFFEALEVVNRKDYLPTKGRSDSKTMLLARILFQQRFWELAHRYYGQALETESLSSLDNFTARVNMGFCDAFEGRLQRAKAVAAELEGNWANHRSLLELNKLIALREGGSQVQD